MILDIADFFDKTMKNINDFIDKNYSEPFFWIIIFLVLFIVSMYFISKVTEK